MHLKSHVICLVALLGTSSTQAQEVSHKPDVEPVVASANQPTRHWSLAVDIGRGASGPASDIEQAMRHAGLSDTCPCFGSLVAHPFSNTGFMSIGLPVLLEVEYRTREPWSLAATFSRTPVGSTSGYRDPLQFVGVEYGVYSAGLSINAAYRMVQAGIGPAVYIPLAREESDPQRPWSHHTKVGFVAGGRTAVPAGARFFVEVRAEYRFVGRVDVGPYTASLPITGAAATLPSTPVRYNHWFVGFGPGVRF